MRGWTQESTKKCSTQFGFPAHAGMDPWRSPASELGSRLPRTRGDGPYARPLARPLPPASPHTRGWTRRRSPWWTPCAGFPAHAGMDPAVPDTAEETARLPGTRGDGPGSPASRACRSTASPHTRGWTRLLALPPCVVGGFPAHAGMDPGQQPACRAGWGLPRTRGDGPAKLRSVVRDLEASPHTRGWTPVRPARHHRRGGFPAHAGMDPWGSPASEPGTRLPRTRGDGPRRRRSARATSSASPHTRGWTAAAAARKREARGFPAHAGMDPGPRAEGGAARGLPRTRGDGPAQALREVYGPSASPHTRGWTPRIARRHGPDRGFPAHAGMDPRHDRPRQHTYRLPRTRGDGPRGTDFPTVDAAASPHTRGWTVLQPGRREVAPGFPAHAGMDPSAPRSPRGRVRRHGKLTPQRQ